MNLFHSKTREMQRGYNFGPKKMFSGIKVIFLDLSPDSKEEIYRNDSFNSGEDFL